MIREIYINNFGKFYDKTIKFESGINQILGENEAGKTTIINFISMIFYGNSSKSRDLLQNERKKYQPWNGAEMKGHIIIEKQGITYKVERSFNKSNSTDVVRVYNNDTGKEVKVPDNNEPGTFFFGVGLESFQKTMNISSEDVVITNDQKKDEITRRLVNLVTTGEEDISYKKAISNLESKMEKLISKNRKSGEIVELRGYIEELIEDLNQAKEDEKEKDSIKLEIDIMKEKIKEYQKRIDDYSFAIEKKTEMDKILLKKNEFESQIKFSDNSYNEEKLDGIQMEIDKLEKESPIIKFNILDLFIIPLVYSVINLGNSTIIYMGLAILSTILLIWGQYKKIKDKKEKLALLYSKEEKIIGNLDKQNKKIKNINEEIHYIDRAISEINYDLKDIGLFDNSEYIKFREIEKNNEFTIKENIARLEAQSKEKFRGKENYSTIEYKIQKGKEKLKLLEHNYDLLVNTKEYIEKSFSELEVDFSKILGEHSSELINKITDGKYEKLLISNDFEIKVLDSKTKEFRDWRYLSSGTIDQFYLALRLAITKLIVDDKNNRILMLDDIFMRFDDTRKDITINLLVDNAKEFEQILLFTNKIYDIKDSNLIKL